MRIDGNFNLSSLFNIAGDNPVERLFESVFGGPADVQAYRGELAPGQEVTIPNETSMPDYNQGQTNGCGTTSLAMIMTYLGVPMTQGDVDSAIRRVDVFTSPTDILDFARANGLSAEGYNHGSLDEMKGFLDKGIPCQALITADGSGDMGEMHYVAVVGYGKDASGNDYVKIHDPATGKTTDVPQAQFEKEWGSTPLGFDHYFNAFAPGGTQLPPSRFDGIEGTLAAADGLTNVTNNFDRLIHPHSVGDFVHGMFGLPGGIVETIGGGIGTGIELGANWLKTNTKNIPVLGDIVAPFADIVGGVGAGIGDLSRGIGSAWDHVGGAFGSLFKGDFGGFFGGLFNAGGDVLGGVFGAAGDVLSGVGKAVGDVASSVGNAVSSAVSAVGDFFSSIF
jgi:uncharacterized protein YvpB